MYPFCHGVVVSAIDIFLEILKDLAQQDRRVWLCGMQPKCSRLLLGLPEFRERFADSVFYSIQQAVQLLQTQIEIDMQNESNEQNQDGDGQGGSSELDGEISDAASDAASEKIYHSYHSVPLAAQSIGSIN